MDVLTLTAWLVSLPLVVDDNHHPIPRPPASARVIATVSMGTPAPELFAAWLDELAAHDSAYRTTAAGDCPGLRAGDPTCTRELHAQSCGAWQTPCARTSKSPLEQAKLAIRILQQALEQCEAHPLWAYASGSCNKTPIAARYEREVNFTLTAHPYVEGVDS